MIRYQDLVALQEQCKFITSNTTDEKMYIFLFWKKDPTTFPGLTPAAVFFYIRFEEPYGHYLVAGSQPVIGLEKIMEAIMRNSYLSREGLIAALGNTTIWQEMPEILAEAMKAASNTVKT